MNATPMSLRLALGALAGLLMAWGHAAHAQQTFGQADRTGGGLGGYGQPAPQGQPGQYGAPPQGQAPGQFGGAPHGQQPGQYGAPPQGQAPGQYGGAPYGQQPGQYGAPPQGQAPGQFGGAPYGQQPGQYGAPPQGQVPGQYGGPPSGQPGAAGQGPYGAQPGMHGGPGGMNPQFAQMLDQMAQFERQDAGVPASDQLHTGAMHGPTPASIPGGQIITTKGLFELIQSQQTPYMLFDVLGGDEILPGAVPAVQASSPGSFDDGISKQMGLYLEQATRGNKQIPLIFYCASVECWMSYNAALRAIRLGYSNVLWYRGGIAAWKHAGGPTMPAAGGAQPQGR